MIFNRNMFAWLKGRVERSPSRYKRVTNIATGAWTNLISAGDDRGITALVRVGDLTSTATTYTIATTSGHRFDISRDSATNTIRCARGAGLTASNYVIAIVM